MAFDPINAYGNIEVMPDPERQWQQIQFRHASRLRKRRQTRIGLVVLVAAAMIAGLAGLWLGPLTSDAVEEPLPPIAALDAEIDMFAALATSQPEDIMSWYDFQPAAWSEDDEADSDWGFETATLDTTQAFESVRMSLDE